MPKPKSWIAAAVNELVAAVHDESRESTAAAAVQQAISAGADVGVVARQIAREVIEKLLADARRNIEAALVGLDDAEADALRLRGETMLAEAKARLDAQIDSRWR